MDEIEEQDDSAVEQQQELFELDVSRVDEEDLRIGRSEAVVTATDWTTETIFGQLIKGNIELNPKFQRREAWTDERKSKFIESLVLGFPVPQLVLAERKSPKGTFVVIDGKQRLLAIRRFGSQVEGDEFHPLRLSKLESRNDLNGKCLQDLKDDDQYRDDATAYDNETIRTVVVRNWDDETLLYKIFIRLNNGSLPMSTQELGKHSSLGG